MGLRQLPGRLIGRLAHPKTTVRWRLTLLYGGLFLVSGAALLAITYAIVSYEVNVRGGGVSLNNTTPNTPPAVAQCCSRRPAQEFFRHSSGWQMYSRLVALQERVDQLHQLEVWSAVALGIMALVSMLVGWVIAGRVLAPLRAITSATQQISDTNLHQRLAVDGPPDELTELADTIDGLLERLEVAFEAQRRFVANASHELSTPLAAMRVAVDIALAKPNVSPQVHALDANLRRELDHADRLLDSFLMLARAQHGELGTRGSVSLAQLADDALAARGPEIAAKQLDLHTALAPVCVTGSQTLLARMVDNVIENAVRHNQARGWLSSTSS